VRQAGSALYHVCTAVFMAVEAMQLAPDFRRLALSHLVARHKLLPYDPLQPQVAGASGELLRAVVSERPMSLDEAMQLLHGDA